MLALNHNSVVSPKRQQSKSREGPSPSAPPARAAVSPTLITTTSCDYCEFEEDSYDDEEEPYTVQCAAVVESPKPAPATATVKVRGRLSF